MKKNITEKKYAGIGLKRIRQVQKQTAEQRLTIGLDLGDRTSHYCILNEQGDIVIQGSMPTSKAGLKRLFEKMPLSRVALEVGGHSTWVSRYLAAMGHEVIVANARNVAWITQSRRKNDRLDAEKLARLARLDPQMLSPIRHRGEQAQKDLAVIRSRAVLIEARTSIINSVRGQAKSLGERLESCDADQVGTKLAGKLPADIRSLVEPLLTAAAHLTEQIKALDAAIHAVAQRYPEIQLLTPIYGVGELTALTFVLVIEECQRFGKSREVGPYLGLVPGQDQSGGSDPGQRITKEGDKLLRWMLVQCAHCILKRGAPDSDLRRWGLAKVEEGNQVQAKSGKKPKGKKRAVVAVARRLAVLMHKLWSNGEVYDPLYGAKAAEQAARRAAGKRTAS
jgi:transposase